MECTVNSGLTINIHAGCKSFKRGLDEIKLDLFGVNIFVIMLM